MPVYTRRLGSVVPPAPDTWTLVATAPNSGTTVIRDIVATNASATTIPLVAFRIVPGPSSSYIWVAYWTSFPIGHVHLDLRQVLAPTERLEVFTQTATLSVLVSGYHFDT